MLKLLNIKLYAKSALCLVHGGFSVFLFILSECDYPVQAQERDCAGTKDAHIDWLRGWPRPRGLQPSPVPADRKRRKRIRRRDWPYRFEPISVPAEGKELVD